MPRINARSGEVLMAMAACWMLGSHAVCASEEAVDRETRAALALDAHPDRGAAQFARYCARCHGSQAQGDASRAIPSLAGQRFTYLVRQLANVAGGERDSDTMHRLEAKGLGSRVAAIETEDKMTDPQIAEKVRKFFTGP